MRNFRLLYLLVLLLPLLIDAWDHTQEPSIPEVQTDKSLKIWLTINALKNAVEVSWRNAPAFPGDRIILSKLNGNFSQQAAAYTVNVEESNGLRITNLKFNYTEKRNLTAQTRCYDYIATYEDSIRRVLSVGCIRVYPTWMHDLDTYIGGLRIRDILIPGAHDAGAYYSALPEILPFEFAGNVSVTQDEDLWSQLMHGVRYLDIRITHNPVFPERFYIHHGVVRFATLRDAVNQVKKFVMETKEVVIFGARFDGDKDYHSSVVNFLRDGFNGLYVNATLSWNATLREIWNTNRYVILAYDHQNIVSQYPEILFTPVKQRWGNVNTKDDLDTYLRSINDQDVERLSERPVSDMAELTPTPLDVTLYRRDLRQMADEVNHHVSDLYRDELGENANIVAVDFLRGTDIVNIALDWNMRKLSYNNGTK